MKKKGICRCFGKWDLVDERGPLTLFQGLNPFQRIIRRQAMVLYGTLLVFWLGVWLTWLLPGSLIPRPPGYAWAGENHALSMRIGLWIGYFGLDSGPYDEYFADYWGFGFLFLFALQLANLFVTIDRMVRRLQEEFQDIPDRETAVVRAVISLPDARLATAFPFIYLLVMLVSPWSFESADTSFMLFWVGGIILPTYLAAILLHGYALMSIGPIGRFSVVWWVLPVVAMSHWPLFDVFVLAILGHFALLTGAGIILGLAYATDPVGPAEFAKFAELKALFAPKDR